MNLSKGWALTLGVFLGFQVARIQDKMPFIVNAVVQIRDMVRQAVWVPDEDEGESGSN